MNATARAVLVAVILCAASVACGDRPGLGFSPEALPTGTVGVPYSAVITVGGNQTPVGGISADTDLPPGLELHWDENGDRNRAELSGTPTTVGFWPVSISAWCLGTNVSGQTGGIQYIIQVR